VPQAEIAAAAALYITDRVRTAYRP